jgi:spermidine synthase
MIDGVEIDGEIIEAGNQYFDMKGTNLESHSMDGRSFLSSTPKKYDIIIIDAYKQPYIPFHLTTYEFFTEIKEHLKKGGVVGINVASLTPDSKILGMLGNTMARVYGEVYVINPPGSLNHIIVASDDSISFDVGITTPELIKIVSEVKEVYKPIQPVENLGVLTDDKAPVEMYTDMMIFGYILTQDTGEYTQLFE